MTGERQARRMLGNATGELRVAIMVSSTPTDIGGWSVGKLYQREVRRREG